MVSFPSLTTKTHQLAILAPRWNLTSRIFQLPLATLALPTLYVNLGGGSSRPGISAILFSMEMPKPGMGGWGGERAMVENPRVVMNSALARGGLAAYLIISAVALSLSLSLYAFPDSMSHNSAGTQLSLLAEPTLTTGKVSAYLSLICGYS